MNATDAYRHEQLCAEVQRLRANLQPSRPQEWEQHAARDAELSRLRLKVVELESMCNDLIDERNAAFEQLQEYQNATPAARFAIRGRTPARKAAGVRKARRR